MSTFIIILINLLAPINGRSIVAYSINEKSSLTISGTSNINCFECTTTNYLENGQIVIERDYYPNMYKFYNSIIQISIRSFKCGNSFLNRDFYNTLAADSHPTIDIELLNATTPPGRNDDADTGNVLVTTSIRINSVARKEEITVNYSKTNNVYRFNGSKVLMMSDFGISAPVSPLKLIKVNNEITIHFDLYVGVHFGSYSEKI